MLKRSHPWFFLFIQFWGLWLSICLSIRVYDSNTFKVLHIVERLLESISRFLLWTVWHLSLCSSHVKMTWWWMDEVRVFVVLSGHLKLFFSLRVYLFPAVPSHRSDYNASGFHLLLNSFSETAHQFLGSAGNISLNPYKHLHCKLFRGYVRK